MSISRRTILQWAAAPLALGTREAFGQAPWPERSIRIVVGFPAGQTADINARQFAKVLWQELGQTIVVENRPGANGLLAAQEVKHAKPDGYTLLWGGSGPLAINPSLYKKVPYDPLKDFEPICLVTLGPLYLIAHPAFPARNVQELIAYAKANPGKVDYGTAGNGSTAHLAMKLFEAAADVELHHIPYKGSPAALNDLASGQIPLMMEAGTSAVPQIRSGKVRALGMTGGKRSPFMPSVPTLAEQGVKDFEALAWNALVAPAGTPAPIIAKISNAVRKAIDDPEASAALRASGTQVAWMDTAEFSGFLRKELRKWARAIELSGAQVE